jgi:hypothetical protein
MTNRVIVQNGKTYMMCPICGLYVISSEFNYHYDSHNVLGQVVHFIFG